MPLPKKFARPILELLDRENEGDTREEQVKNRISWLKKAWELLPTEREKYSEYSLVWLNLLHDDMDNIAHIVMKKSDVRN